MDLVTGQWKQNVEIPNSLINECALDIYKYLLEEKLIKSDLHTVELSWE